MKKHEALKEYYSTIIRTKTIRKTMVPKGIKYLSVS